MLVKGDKNRVWTRFLGVRPTPFIEECRWGPEAASA